MSETLKKIMDAQKKSIKVDANANVDKKCPFTGNLKLRGKTFRGIVVSKDTHKTVRVTWTTKHFVKKYERFMLKRTKVAAHNPEVINAKIGDEVIIAECKPISKTKKFIVIQNLGHSKDYMIKKESIEDDKKVVKEKELKSKVNDDKKTQDVPIDEDIESTDIDATDVKEEKTDEQ